MPLLKFVVILERKKRKDHLSTLSYSGVIIF